MSACNAARFQALTVLSATAGTDQGKIRDHNEDAYFTDVEHGVFIVADGLGGHAGGEVAAGMVVSHLPSLLDTALSPDIPLCSPVTVKAVYQAIGTLNRLVCEAGRRQPELAGMGSTLVLALIRQGAMLMAHAGDSRAYLLHNGRLVRLTRDHSVIQEMLDAGLITPGEAAVHPSRAMVTQCIGTPGAVSPDIRCLDFRSGDRLLLCSDGLTNMIADPLIENILEQRTDLDTVSRDLLQAANDAGGEDNITAVVVGAASGRAC